MRLGQPIQRQEEFRGAKPMTLWLHHCQRAAAIQLLAASVWLWTASILWAEPFGFAEFEPSAALCSVDVEKRLLQLEHDQQTLLEKNRQLSLQLRRLASQDQGGRSNSLLDGSLIPPAPSDDNSINEFNDVFPFEQSGGIALGAGGSPLFDTADEFPLERGPRSALSRVKPGSFVASFDRGFVIRSTDAEESPFELKINGQDQIRYTGLAHENATWTDSAGNVTPLANMSSFQIPRGRLIFSGFAFRKELLYNLNIDYNTVGNSQINFRAYWLAWRFNRSMTIYAGQSKVPGGREWLLSFVDTQGVDRSMATTFFRPSLSQGIWATGEPADGVFYHVMMSNGFNTLGSTPQQLSSLMAFSGSIWCEPLGDFGRGYSDFEWHAEPAIRVGSSLTYAPEAGPQGGSTVPENSPIRLSDGTLITQTGALAPGITLNAFKIGLASVDFAYKHRGISVSCELYSQSLFALRANGAIPQSSIYQYGGFAQIGYFVIPQKLEPYVRTSHVTGPFGAGAEYAGGYNWFFLPGKQNLRFTLDGAWLDHCPADQNRTNYQAGQTGILVRSQIQLYF